VTDQRFSLGTPVSSTNKYDCHDIAEILLEVALNTINLEPIMFPDEYTTKSFTKQLKTFKNHLTIMKKG
jgi:hypothetical protein